MDCYGALSGYVCILVCLVDNMGAAFVGIYGHDEMNGHCLGSIARELFGGVN